MKVVILAGGTGTRLQPYTTVFPKPMMPLGQRPILDIVVQQLVHYGFWDIVLSVGYLSELIQAYFETAKNRFYDVDFTYIREDKPMGTAGPLGRVPDIDRTFMVMNGDVLTTLNYQDIVDYHRRMGGILTIGMYRKTVKIDLGVINAGSDGIITGYTEKPEKNYMVSMGVYVFEPDIHRYIEPDTHLDFPDLVHRLISNGEIVSEDPGFGASLKRSRGGLLKENTNRPINVGVGGALSVVEVVKCLL